jgi:DNA-binding transcriptional MocR family regulator
VRVHRVAGRARASSGDRLTYERTGAEEVVVTSCAEEGIFLLYHALLRPGDHVIVETPCYEVGARGRAQHRR